MFVRLENGVIINVSMISALFPHDDPTDRWPWRLTTSGPDGYSLWYISQEDHGNIMNVIESECGLL